MGILIKPIVTEKMTVQGDKLNRYGFIVDREANKIEIKKAVEQMYSVSVKDVNTVNKYELICINESVGVDFVNCDDLYLRKISRRQINVF